MHLNRRTLLKATGAAGALSMVPSTVTAAPASTEIDPAFDDDADLHEALVVFDRRENVALLDQFDLVEGYYAFRQLPIGYAVLTGEQLTSVASIPSVRYVEKNEEMEYHNDDAREVTGVERVQEGHYYTGETVHAVVIDSGVDGDHPDLQGNLRHNFRFVDPLRRDTPWIDAGPADTASLGHGTHVSGSVAGTGQESDGQYRGMAPDADLTVYSTDAVAFLLQLVAAYDDMIHRQRTGRHEVQIANNSWGPVSGNDVDYSPNAAINLATWEANEVGILTVFSMGNSGPSTNTMGNYAKGPHILASAATRDDTQVTDFSSRGRRKYDDDGTAIDWDGEGANWDRQLAFENLTTLHSFDYTEQPVVDERSYSGNVGPAADTIYGPKVSSGSGWHEWQSPADAGYVEASLSWTPDGQDVDFYVHEGSRDGTVVASSTGGLGANPEVIRAQIDGGTTYWIEVRPWANVQASYDVELTAHEVATDEPTEPFGLYRPAAGTPGSWVMSTLSPDDPLQTYGALSALLPVGEEPEPEYLTDQQVETAQEPYYGMLSGTSMSAPVLSGICALVVDAYRQNHGEFPDPIEVVRIVEATSKDALDSYTPYNVGTGFADAAAAVARAESGDVPGWDETELVGETATEPLFQATGTRADDGSAFTAGQTNHVEVTLEDSNADASTVRDRIPFDWDVVGGDHDRVYTTGGDRYVAFDDVAPGETVSYFVEAPDSTGNYEFGPAEAKPTSDDVAGHGFVTIVGTDTNGVVGVDQNATGL